MLGGVGRSRVRLRWWAVVPAAGFLLSFACAQQSVECGNGAVEPGEECDDGNVSNDDACTALCRLSICGDGVTNRSGEECDDGAHEAGDGCSPICTREGAMCGNGSLEVSGVFPEECDDGNIANGDGCSASCFIELARCGDGVRQGDEECDDGDREPGDGCNANCQTESPDGGEVADGRDGETIDGRDGETVEGVDGEFVEGLDGELSDSDVLDVPDGWECHDPVCDLAPQCGCGEGRKCTLVAGSRSCAAAGFLSEGRTCASDMECAEALMCSGARNSSESLCYRFCGDDTDCVGAGSRCVVGVSTGGAPIPGVTLCSLHCDPSNTFACPLGTGCKIWSYEGEYLTDCGGPVGLGHVGRDCSSDADCAPGYFCAPGFPTCLQYCTLPEGYCEGGYPCTEFDPPVRIGTQRIGYCG
jgi:cysteine-rich repeat protein